MYTAYNDSVDVAQVLIEAGADVNAKSNSGKTVLMFASNYDAPNVQKLLRAAGAR
ncbi:MAG: hypothetical protein J1E07_10775, partial [Treponema sp.]|nr:hypothetical protein [Treponema sp.]